MIRKLFTIVLCIALAMLPAAAEEAGVPGVRLSVDRISMTVGGETFEPDLSICLDEAKDDLGLFGSFYVTLGEDRLLPVHAKILDEGVAIKLGNSSVYCFGPEMLDREASMEAAEPLPSMSEIAYGFVEYLDSFEEDSFELEPLELLAWLESTLHLETGALRQWVTDDMLPTVTAERDSLGYTIAVGDEEPSYITLRRSEQRVTLNGYGESLIVGADNSVQFSSTYGVDYEGYYSQSVSITFKYLPQAEGGAEYSFIFKMHEYYQEESYRALGCDTHFSVIGGSDAEGVHEAKVSYREDYEDITDLSLQLYFSVVPAQVSDAIAGQKTVMIESDTDSGMSSITFAAMGLFSDVERLMNDASVSGMIDAFNAQVEEYDEIYYQDFEDYDGYYYVDFEVPEFGWMPEGLELADVEVTETGVQSEYAMGEGGMLYIVMEKNGAQADEDALAYAAEEGSFTASIIEDGIETRIYSDDFVLTEAEVMQILEGRIWPGAGYDDGTNKSM